MIFLRHQLKLNKYSVHCSLVALVIKNILIIFTGSSNQTKTVL